MPTTPDPEWRCLLPEEELRELHSLLLLAESAGMVDLTDLGAMRELREFFTALQSLEYAGRRLREQALRALLEVSPPRRPVETRALADLANLAGVPLVRAERLAKQLAAERTITLPEPEPVEL